MEKMSGVLSINNKLKWSSWQTPQKSEVWLIH
jgi:hypothetical protein